MGAKSRRKGGENQTLGPSEMEAGRRTEVGGSGPKHQEMRKQAETSREAEAWRLVYQDILRADRWFKIQL